MAEKNWRKDFLEKLDEAAQRETKYLIDNDCDIVSGNLKFGKLGLGTNLYFVAIDWENEDDCKIATFEDFYEALKHFKLIIKEFKINTSKSLT